jgi:hypothetical protein
MPETEPPDATTPAADPHPDGDLARPTSASAADLRAALEKAEAAGAENWNRYLRSVAELDNVRKRAARDVEAARRSGVEKLAGRLNMPLLKACWPASRPPCGSSGRRLTGSVSRLWTLRASRSIRSYTRR